MERSSNNKSKPFKLRSPFKQDKPKVRVTTGFGPEADKVLTDKVNIGRGGKKKVAKKTGVKIAKQVGKRLLGPVGVAYTAYDLYNIGKHSVKEKSLKKGIKKWWNE